MQAGFRFIQHHERRRTRRQERSNPKQIAQCSIRQFRDVQWSKHAMLLHLEGEATGTRQNSYPAARESIGNRCFKRLVIADFVNRLNGSRKIRSVVSEDRSSSADLRQSRWRVRICPEMIVEAP